MSRVLIKELANHLRSNPLMLHIGPIGLLRLAPDNLQRFTDGRLIDEHGAAAVAH